MKWEQIVITDHQDKEYKSENAREFAKEHCPSGEVTINDEGSIQIQIQKDEVKTTDDEVKKYLSAQLKTKIRSMLIKAPVSTESNPVARAEAGNTLNRQSPKLKVVFIYTYENYPSLNTTESPVDWIKKVKLTTLAASEEILEVANSETIPKVIGAGAYKITPVCEKSDKDKFDFDAEYQTPELKSGDELTVFFAVDLLYQKVQFVAHCLLTVPNYKFVPTVEDEKKVNIIEDTDGKQILAFKTNLDSPDGFYNQDDVSSILPHNKADIKPILKDGKATLTLKKYKLPDEYYQFEDIDPGKNVIKRFDAVTVGIRKSPNMLKIEFMDGKSEKDLNLGIEGFEKATIQSGRLILKMKGSASYEVMSEADLNEKIKVEPRMIKSITKSGENTYDIQFMQRFKKYVIEVV